MGVQCRRTQGPAIERSGDLAAILSDLERGDVLFIDEIHGLPRKVEEVLYPAMEDFELDLIVGQGPTARSMRLALRPFTLVAATTRPGLLNAPLRDRFGATHRLDYYSVDDSTSGRLPVHMRFAAAGLLVYVCLDLSRVSEGAYTFCGLPLRLSAVEAAPVRAVIWR